MLEIPIFSNNDYALNIIENINLTPEEKFNIFNNCRCCSIHQLNRPIKYEPWSPEMSIKELRRTQEEKEEENACPCRCRRFIRFICMECETPISSDSGDLSSKSNAID